MWAQDLWRVVGTVAVAGAVLTSLAQVHPQSWTAEGKTCLVVAINVQGTRFHMIVNWSALCKRAEQDDIFLRTMRSDVETLLG